MIRPGPSLAQDPWLEQQQLFQRMVREPTNYDITFAFVKVATARGDYEAAIGALERLLFYEPKLTRVKYELGALYFRLGSYEMAKRYFREALESPYLDPVTQARIYTYLPDAEKQLQPSRFSGFLQTGLRSQSNASFAPTSGAIVLGGQDFALLPIATRKADWNWFGLAGLSHDYDLQNQRGDVIETRFVGYGTHQFRLDELDVGLFEASIGPRLAFAPELLPGVTIKPYVVGGKAWIDGASYLSSGGAGVSMQIPVGPRVTVGPEVEWRRAVIHTGDFVPVSEFNSGDWLTAGAASTVKITERIKLDARGFYRRGGASLSFQTFNQWVGEAALTIELTPPWETISRYWTLSPFVRFIRTDFGAPDPFIDPRVAHRDNEWRTGVVLDAPIAKGVGLSAALQYDRTSSTLPNFRQNNLSIMFGPTARF